MEITASLKYLKIAPRKVRLVANIIKGLPISSAEDQLRHISNRSAAPILKLLMSAKANAVNNFHLDPSTLFIKSIVVNQGPMLKRALPRAHGATNVIRHRMSHIVITLDTAHSLKSLNKVAESPEIVKTQESKTFYEKNKPRNKNTKFYRETKQTKAKKGQVKPIIQRKVIK